MHTRINKIMDGVMRCEAALREKAGKVLFTEKEGYLRAGRRYRATDCIQPVRLDLLGMPETYRQAFEDAELLRRDHRAHRSVV